MDELDYFFKLQLEQKAANDTHDYLKVLNNTDFETPEQRAMYFYKQYKPPGY